MNKKKPFAPRRREPTELHFFSSLPLDEAIKCLEQLPPEYELKIIAEDADDCRFEIHYGNRRVADAAMGRGTLRRWEGTFTRLDFDAQILWWKPDTLEEIRENPIRSDYWLVILIFATVGLMTSAMLCRFGFSPIVGITLILTGLAIPLILFFGKIALKVRTHRYPLQLLDNMFGALEDTFKAAGVVADTPDSLTEQTMANHSEHTLSSYQDIARHE